MQNRCFAAENRAETDLLAATCHRDQPNRPQNHAKNPSPARVSTLRCTIFSTPLVKFPPAAGDAHYMFIIRSPSFPPMPHCGQHPPHCLAPPRALMPITATDATDTTAAVQYNTNRVLSAAAFSAASTFTYMAVAK